SPGTSHGAADHLKTFRTRVAREVKAAADQPIGTVTDQSCTRGQGIFAVEKHRARTDGLEGTTARADPDQIDRAGLGAEQAIVLEYDNGADSGGSRGHGLAQRTRIGELADTAAAISVVDDGVILGLHDPRVVEGAA